MGSAGITETVTESVGVLLADQHGTGVVAKRADHFCILMGQRAEQAPVVADIYLLSLKTGRGCRLTLQDDQKAVKTSADHETDQAVLLLDGVFIKRRAIQLLRCLLGKLQKLF